MPVTINLVVSDEVLLGDTGAASSADDTAVMEGYGVVPAGLARQVAGAAPNAQVQLRRLYATPTSGALVAMDSRSRCFPPALAEFIRLRDRVCRTPWCDAPVRHVDHVRAHADGGPTSSENAQGLCEACNLAQAAPGWAASTNNTPAHTITTTTPTGATYDSTTPPTPRPLPRGRPGPDRVESSWIEWTLEMSLDHELVGRD